MDTQGYKQTLGMCDYMNMQKSLHVSISLLRYIKLPVLLSCYRLCLSVQFWSTGFYYHCDQTGTYSFITFNVLILGLASVRPYYMLPKND